MFGLFQSTGFNEMGIRPLSEYGLERTKGTDGFLFSMDEGNGFLTVMDGQGHTFAGVKVRTSLRNRYSHIVGGVQEGRRSKGLGSLGMYEIIRFLFSNLPIERVEVTILAGNQTSLRMHEKLGFMIEGIKRKAWFHNGRLNDQYFLSLLRSEFEQAERELSNKKMEASGEENCEVSVH